MEEPKGPSKKELNKLARKEKRKDQPGDSAAASAPSNENWQYTVFISKGSVFSADVTRTLTLYLGDLAPKVRYSVAVGSSKEHQPIMYAEPISSNLSNTISGDLNIARFIARSCVTDVYGNNDAWISSQIDQWLELYSNAKVFPGYMTTLNDVLEAHLAHRTYLVGDGVTLADLAIYTLLTKSNVTLAGVNGARWCRLLQNRVPALTAIPLTFVPNPNAAPTTNNAAAEKPKKEKTTTAPATGAKAATNESAKNEDEGGTCPPLEGAVDGQVLTRFPPEPSGYLHIGHAKAVLLNEYYSKRYNGKMLVRFDDTNPSKEKDEFEDNILQDLHTLKVNFYKISHSSDYFDKCEDIARKMIKEGKAYMDNTDQETMQAERLERKESKNRNTTPEENLKIFDRLLKGEADAQSYCMRAKIDMNSVNGTMRDPVMYRYNATPHHRTGTKYKAYPTYDFVCPILDAIEGVTHALRTTEYNDRDEQYHWIQNALELRYVHIQTFGKMNFVNTVLSKRKLTWFVENKFVEGWFDPRFPTIQGCVRRGMNIDALKSFIISQGASRRVITMEWDKFWAENKKILEEACPRYMGVSCENVVEMLIENVPAEITLHTVQVHPQKPEHGTRVMRRFNKLYIDQIDAQTYSLNEDVTLLRWGNMKITAIDKDSNGVVTGLRATYDAEATNFSKTKKATWLAAVPDVVPVKLVEFDHLISKAKIADDEDFKDFVNPNTRTESDGLVDPCVRFLNAGDVIQLERKGFYRIDKAYGGSADKPAVLLYIPDGKVKAPAKPVVKK